MRKLQWTLLAAIGLGCVAATLTAQEPPHAGDMRFVNELRKRRYNDLALEYLRRLGKTASPLLKKELPLEIAKTQLEAAGDEPDTSKRLVQYRETQAEFKKFLAENKTHPRASEVKLDLARVLVLQGRTELSRAWLQDNLESRVAEGLKARATFLEAETALKAASVEIGKAYDIVKESTTAEDKVLAKKLKEDEIQCDLEKGLNFFDQGLTFLEERKDAVLRSAQKMEQAQKVLAKVTGMVDENNPIHWQAKAWEARCHHELGVPNKARAAYTSILGAGRQAAEGQRLARYFRMLVIAKDPEPAEKEKLAETLIDAGTRWLNDYPAFRKSDEANGVRYLLAQAYVAQSENPKVPANVKAVHLTNARAVLKVIESTENEFTDRARRDKITIINKQGGFKTDIAKLTTFEDCYVRAQYELAQMSEDAKTLKDDKLDEKRKERSASIVKALSLGLAKPDAKGKKSLEISNARAILTFYSLQTGNYKLAIEVGEAYAQEDPKAAQAAMSAIYALQAYAQSIAERERKMAMPEDVKEERDRMTKLAQYMKLRWPSELAGNLARHQLALVLLREKNLPDAIREFSSITPTYPSFTNSQFQLAEACQQAEKDKLEPIPGDKTDGYRTRAIAALESIPELQAPADAVTNQMYLMSRVKLLQEWYKVKKYVEMDALAKKLLARTSAWTFHEDKVKDAGMKEYFAKALGDIELYALYGQAQAFFDKANHAEVVKLLDPLVAAAKANPNHQVIKNQQLGNALLSMELRSNVQLNKTEQARQVIPLLQALAKEAGSDAGAITVLKQLVAIMQRQLDETSKKDEATIARMRTGFTAILDDVAKQEATPKPEFTLVLTQCYAMLDEHKKAAGLLEKVPEPKADDMQGKKLHQSVRLLLARMLRLSGDVEKARKILHEEIIGKDRKEWGSRSIDALKEEVLLLETDGNFALGAKKANELVQKLIKKANTDNALKEQYLECYFHVVYCFLNHGKSQTDPAKRAKFIKDAANQIDALEKRWPEFGTEASKKRFTELLEKELELKQVYDDFKKAAAAAGN